MGKAGPLASVRDWQLLVNLGKQLKFLDIIAATTLRPYSVLISRQSRKVILIELTMPCEDWLEEAQERKRAKYADLVADCWRQGWKARCEPVEV